MRATKQVQKILSYYEGENAGVKGNPAVCSWRESSAARAR